MDMLMMALQNKGIMLAADLFSAGIGLLMLLSCMVVGAKILRIDIYAAIDKVEKNPLAYSIFVTGHFLGAAYVLGSTFTV